MNVHLASELFLDEAVDQTVVLEIIWLASEGRHLVFADIDDMRLSQWLGRHSPQSIERCRFGLDESIVRAAEGFYIRDVRVRPGLNNWNTLSLCPESALAFLRYPFQVWLENDMNDSSFLLCCAKQELAEKLRCYEQSMWIQFQHAGGLGSMPDRIARMTADRRWLNFFVFDSDSRLPGIRSEQAQAVVSACVQSSVDFHCLSRRAIENYIPVRTLNAWAYQPSFRGREARIRQNRVGAFGRASDVQRQHFNLKTGFRGDVAGNERGEWRARRDEIDMLFSSINDGDRSWLKEGIQRDIATQIYGKTIIPYTHLFEYGTGDELSDIALNILRRA